MAFIFGPGRGQEGQGSTGASVPPFFELANQSQASEEPGGYESEGSVVSPMSPHHGNAPLSPRGYETPPHQMIQPPVAPPPIHPVAPPQGMGEQGSTSSH
jgi:hypothetical protein